MATVNIGNIKFNWKGPWSNSTTYAVDDVVSLSGSSYISIQAGSNQNPASASAYWQQMSSAGTNGTNGTDLTSTLTTQGDIVYRDGSGLARLGYGTAGQALITNGSGANPSWGTVSDNYSTQLFHATEGTFATNTTNSWTKLGLSTLRTNEITGASLGSGVITLPAGTYICQGYCGFYRNDGCNNKLRNTTDGADLLIGSGGHTWQTNDATVVLSAIAGKFTLSAQKNIELQYYIENSNNQTTVQSGHPNSVMLWKTA